jgi:hypothetical protein
MVGLYEPNVVHALLVHNAFRNIGAKKYDNDKNYGKSIELNFVQWISTKPGEVHSCDNSRWVA